MLSSKEFSSHKKIRMRCTEPWESGHLWVERTSAEKLSEIPNWESRERILTKMRSFQIWRDEIYSIWQNQPIDSPCHSPHSWMHDTPLDWEPTVDHQPEPLWTETNNSEKHSEHSIQDDAQSLRCQNSTQNWIFRCEHTMRLVSQHFQSKWKLMAAVLKRNFTSHPSPYSETEPSALDCSGWFRRCLCSSTQFAKWMGPGWVMGQTEGRLVAELGYSWKWGCEAHGCGWSCSTGSSSAAVMMNQTQTTKDRCDAM